ncbi:MAG: hypothetical protein ABR578_14325 [Chromatocurvus sp.]
MIILPMAGLSSRFFKAGYTVPKYMLDLHGAPVFDHALGSFARLFGRERFIIICRDIAGTPAFVRTRAVALGLDPDQLEVVVLERETAGQAETVAAGLRAAGVVGGSPITIFNIDTFRPRFAHPESFDVTTVDGYLEVFIGPGDHWSFVKPCAGTDRVVEVAEKLRISDMCSDGLYHFRSATHYLELFSEVEDRDPISLQGGEYYIAPLYNTAIARGADIRYTVVSLENIRFCGTPEEYMSLCTQPPFVPTPVIL